MKRRLIVVVTLVILGGLGYGAKLGFFQREHDDGSLVLLGNVNVRQVDLAFKVGGRIAALSVDEGDRVTGGQIVASLDRRYFQDDLRIARAREAAQAANLAKLEHGSRPEEIDQARANAELARATAENNHLNLTRQKHLVASNVASQQSYDNALAAARESDAQLAHAQLALRLAELGPRAEDIDGARAQLALEDGNVAASERALADADLVAPAGGMILTRVQEPGAIVTGGATILTLALDAPVWVRAYIGEPDLGRVRPGQTATVTTDSATGKAYRAHVGFISPVAEFTPKSVETRELRTDLVYRLRVIVDAPDLGLRQGMPVTVTLDSGG